MLDIAADLVTQAASNSLAVFCFCNLLIVIILMSPKPSSDFDEGSEFHLPILAHSSLVDEQRIDIERPPEDEETSPEVLELCVCENLKKEGGGEDDDEDDGESTNDDEDDDKGEDDDEDDGEGEDDNEDDGESTNDDDDDEFRRRVEAFIDKVNREWKAEKLRTQSM